MTAAATTSKSGKSGKSGKAQGGCGCKLTGGSLASDSVVQHVDAKAWEILNRNATNVVSFHGGDSSPSTVDVAMNHMKSFVGNIIGMPVHHGGDSVDELISASLSKAALKKYKKAKEMLVAQDGGSMQDGMFKGIQSVTDLMNMSKVSSYLKGGQASSIDSAIDNLTVEGAQKIAELFNDASLFKSGVSLASYVKTLAIDVPSRPAKNLVGSLTKEYKGVVTNFVRNNVSTSNMGKLAIFANAFANASPLPSAASGGGGLDAQQVSSLANALKKSKLAAKEAAKAAKASSSSAKYEGGASTSAANTSASYDYIHAAFPSMSAINRIPPANNATATQNAEMLKYSNMLDPAYSKGFETLRNPVMQLSPADMSKNSLSISLGGALAAAKGKKKPAAKK